MNTKIIIYDDSCPLCAAYTNAFIKSGLIEKEGRKDFSSISPDLINKIDLKRAVNEIPVIDGATSQVWYGIDALLEILQQKIPFAKPIGNIKPVKWLLLKLYKFISYNRRVIVAGSNKPGRFDCTPDFNAKYRIAFLLIFTLVNASLLSPFQANVLSNTLMHRTTIYELQTAYAMLILTNVLVATWLGFKNGIAYLGQVTMLTLMVLLLTIPLILINHYTTLRLFGVNNFYIGMLALFAVQEYRRRMKYIGVLDMHAGIRLINVAMATILVVYFILQ